MIWHNITKKIFNVGDLEDFIQDLSQKDVVMYTEKGNAILYKLLDLECDDTLEEFKNLFKKIHGEPYLKLTKKHRDYLIKQINKQKGYHIDVKEKIISFHPVDKKHTDEVLKLKKNFDFLLQPFLFDFDKYQQ